MKIEPIKDGFGAVISELDLSRDSLEPEIIKTLKNLINQSAVLIIRGQDLTLDNQSRFARNFGSLKKYTVKEFGKTPTPEIIAISNFYDGGHLGNKDVIWHSDSSFMKQPPSYAILYGVEIPSVGGDTYFADMRQAYDSLPQELKNKIQNLHIQHDNTFNAAKEPRVLLKNAQKTGAEIEPGAVHPMIATHPVNGRKSIFLGRVNLNQVVGLELEESKDILQQILDHSTQDKFVIKHQWKKGDLVVWDNRCTLHRRDSFPDGENRLVLRCEAYDQDNSRKLTQKDAA